MKAHLSKSLALLEKYLKETPMNTVEEEFDAYEKKGLTGPAFNELMDSFDEQFNSVHSDVTYTVSSQYSFVLDSFSDKSDWHFSTETIISQSNSSEFKQCNSTLHNKTGNKNFKLAA